MTTAAALFELAHELVLTHERSAPGAITVVPVIVDDLQTARPILRALSELLEGQLFDTGDSTQSELHGPVPGTSDPVRRAAVEAALVVPTGRRVVVTDLPDGLVEAVLENPSIAADPSAGELTLLALARAATHQDLDHHQFAIIAYEEGPIDLPFRRAVWQLTMAHFSAMGSSSLKTLVVVAESAIDIELHCQTDHGFKFAIEGERLLRRQRRDNLTAVTARIARHPHPFVIFLGAGFAASSRLPLGDSVRDGAIRRLLGVPEEESPTSVELASRFHGWLSEKPGWLSESEIEMPEDQFIRQLTLERVITAEKRIYTDLPTLQEFREHHDDVIEAPGSAVLDLMRVLEIAAGRVIIVEVNFDLLVETHTDVPLNVYASEDEFNGAADYVAQYLAGDEQAIPVLKLHGTISAVETCVVSQEQTEQGVGAGKLGALRRLITPNDEPRLWIYVGVSMRDRDVVRVLEGEDFARGLDEIWVSPFLVSTVADFGGKRVPHWKDKPLRSIQDRLVTETADAFFANLRSAFEASSGASET